MIASRWVSNRFIWLVMMRGCSSCQIFLLSSSLEGHENCECAVDKPKFPGAAAVCACCMIVRGWTHECMCMYAWHADGLLLQQRPFIFYQSGLITHKMSGPSIPNSPFLLRAVSTVDNMLYKSRPHQSVFMKTWLTVSVRVSHSLVTMSPPLTDERRP